MAGPGTCVLGTQSSSGCANLNAITYRVSIGQGFGTGILTLWGDKSPLHRRDPISSFAKGCCRFSTSVLISRLVAIDQVFEGKRGSFQLSANPRAFIAGNH